MLQSTSPPPSTQINSSSTSSINVLFKWYVICVTLMDIFEFGYQCYDKDLLLRRCQHVFVSTLLNSCFICAWCSSWQESRENAWRKSASTMGCPWSKQGARSLGHGEFLDGCCSSVPMWPCGFGTGSVWSTIHVNFQGLGDWWKQLISVVLSGRY